LSEYEAKVYLSLVRTGAMKAKKLSVATGVPRPKVYATLRHLVGMGLAVEIPEKPRRYVPAPPAKAFENYLTEYERKTKDLVSVVSSLGRIFDEANNDKDLPQRDVIWILKGKAKIFQKVQEILAVAEDSVEIETCEKGSVLLYEKFNRMFDRLKERSIGVRFATSFGNHNRYVVEQLGHITSIVEADISYPSIFVNVDRRHCLLAVMQPGGAVSGLETETAIFSNNQVFASVVESLLHKKIKGGFTISTMLTAS